MAGNKSKARDEVVDEDEDQDEDEDGDGKAKKRRGPNYITPPGYRRLVDELEFLHTKKRPEVVGALADAAAEGDRSENAEYIYRKRQLREIDRRMRFLSKRLDIVQVVDPNEQKRRDKVFFGATVTVADEEGVEKTFRIVGVDEVQGDKGDISWRSPIGEALLGKDQGDTILVKWQAAGRAMTRELTIIAIAYD
jgi:transcription elongation factor GreB